MFRAVVCDNPFPLATDGRVNPDDMGRQTETAYCQPKGGIAVYAVYDSKGYFLFTATQKQLVEALANAQTKKLHQEVGEKSGWQLWALFTQDPSLHELQLHDTNSGYNYVFKLCGV